MLESRLEETERIARDRNIEDIAPIITTRAKLAIKKGSHQQAEELLELPRTRDNIVALNLLVQLYWREGDRERARELFKEIRQREVTPYILNNFAMLLAEAGEFAEAEDWYLQSLEIDEENAYSQLEYGYLLLDWNEKEPDENTRREMLEVASEAIRKADKLGLDVPKTKKVLERL